MIQKISNIPLEHTPNPEPTVYEGIPFIWGFGEAWGMLQGYVGVLLDMKKRPLDLLPGDVFFFLAALKFHHHLGNEQNR